MQADEDSEGSKRYAFKILANRDHFHWQVNQENTETRKRKMLKDAKINYFEYWQIERDEDGEGEVKREKTQEK